MLERSFYLQQLLLYYSVSAKEFYCENQFSKLLSPLTNCYCQTWDNLSIGKKTLVYLSCLLAVVQKHSEQHLGIQMGALDFKYRVISSFRSPISTLSFSWKIKHFVEQNIFYRSDILHDFPISSFLS